ncbi:hypothetical protein C8F04DRAFT_1258394 [Mycena alexandri]|uniref:Uncharacterized protein n=1 Tax=Mycena alexandri TaxID=1745969 RepID=A0AAD6T042_9AGAR|nr:hypothetical protein C8F04DRAFT_1258394 [Mycena alexandri]
MAEAVVVEQDDAGSFGRRRRRRPEHDAITGCHVHWRRPTRLRTPLSRTPPAHSSPAAASGARNFILPLTTLSGAAFVGRRVSPEPPPSPSLFPFFIYGSSHSFVQAVANTNSLCNSQIVYNPIAHAGSSSSRDTPLAAALPSDFPSPSTPEPGSHMTRALSHNPYFPPAPGAGTTTDESPVSAPVPEKEKAVEKEVIPIPTVAPFASILASTGKSTTTDKLLFISSTNSNVNSTFSAAPPSAVITAPSSISPKCASSTKKPQFVLSPLAGTPPDSPKSSSSQFASTLARLGSRRSRVGPKSGAAPLSAFNAGSGQARARSGGDAAGG